jgi:hypothetical protein
LPAGSTKIAWWQTPLSNVSVTKLDALLLEMGARGVDVVDLERDRQAVRAELLAEGGGLHDGERQVAGLELGPRHVRPSA